MIFETERLFVTRWKPFDLQALHTLYNDTAIKEFILPSLTIDETRHIFENQLKLYKEQFPFGRYFIVEKVSNEFIGLLLFEKNDAKEGVEIGYSLVKHHWKKGYATEIVRQSIHWLFEFTAFSNIYAMTELYNKNSRNVLLKCGFNLRENFIEHGEEKNLFGLERKAFQQ